MIFACLTLNGQSSGLLFNCLAPESVPDTTLPSEYHNYTNQCGHNSVALVSKTLVTMAIDKVNILLVTTSAATRLPMAES